MEIQEILIAILFLAAVSYLIKKLRNTDDNCGNKGCDCK